MTAADVRNPRKTFLIAHGFEAAIAVAGLVTSVQFILDEQIRVQTAVGQTGTLFAWCWTILYLAGSLGILAGLTRPEDRLEIAGLCCFGGACITQSATLVTQRGDQAIYVALVYAAICCGAVSRIYLLLALRRLLGKGRSPTPSSGSRG